MPPKPPRTRMSEVVRRRARVTPVIGVLLSLGFALVVAPIVLVDDWLLPPTVVAGEPADQTVRVPAFEGWDDQHLAGRGGSVVIARGEIATARQAELVQTMRATQPSSGARFAAYAAVLLLLAVGVTHQLRRSNHGRRLRVQLVILGTVALGAVVTKGLLLAFPLSILAVPVALGAIVPTLVFDRTVGLAAGVLSAVTMGLLVPFDVGVSTVLVVQAVAASVALPDPVRPRWSTALIAGAAALGGAVLTYLGFFYLSDGVLPIHELGDPSRSAWLATAFGGGVAGLLAMPVLPLFERACGEISHGRLVAMQDLSQPLLKQIAEKSPGTWQHSLAMANLAEVAAQAIGANGRLVRVGAYFHDLGKSLQPSYFIENLRAGEPSPHDQLAPEVSCDAIFAHVTEGIALARRSGVPERIIDFMHMHHGDGVLEYFWAKCRESGNPRGLTVEDFRYPGVPPQSRETAILAICDAVEAASRTLKRPDERAIETLVQRIVYGKLHLGQLDESGLSMSDLRQISDSLREAIRAAHHDRIEYPWQREANAAAAAGAAATAVTVMAQSPTATQRLMQEPRLDSLDVPRPLQWEGRPPTASEPATAATMPMPTPAPSPGPPAPVAAPAPTAPADATVSLRPPSLDELAKAPTLPPAADMVAATVTVVPTPAAPAVPDVGAAPVLTGPPAGPAADVTAEALTAGSGAAEALAPDAGPAATATAEEREPAIIEVDGDPDLSVVADGDEPALAPAPGSPGGGDGAPARGDWAASLANRLDAMLDDEEAAFGHAPTHRTPPPPPRGRITHEIASEDVEGTIELAPTARTEHSGLIKGPPPATRQIRTMPLPAPGPLPDPGPGDGAEGDGPTVVRPRPAGSMLPPRSRTKSD
ncbi:MAG: HDIG domain-containing protein [Kofleriaceae bacterium]